MFWYSNEGSVVQCSEHLKAISEGFKFFKNAKKKKTLSIRRVIITKVFFFFLFSPSRDTVPKDPHNDVALLLSNNTQMRIQNFAPVPVRWPLSIFSHPSVHPSLSTPGSCFPAHVLSLLHGSRMLVVSALSLKGTRASRSALIPSSLVSEPPRLYQPLSSHSSTHVVTDVWH